MLIWKERREKLLLFVVATLFVALCCIEYGFPLPALLARAGVGDLLTANATKSTASGLIIGVISAYFFYIFIELIPRKRREERTLRVLNSLLASVLDAYSRSRVFGHETPISHVNREVLKHDWLISQIPILKENKSTFLKLKFATETAHSRLEDFRHALPLAVTLSPHRAMQWLVITDKIRLLAENYGEQPEIPSEQSHLVDTNTNENPIFDYKSTLNLRVLEVVEETQSWLYPSVQQNG